jgi:glucokinase
MAALWTQQPTLVFDIGGTNVRGALCDGASPRILRTIRRPTPNFLSHPDADADSLIESTLAEVVAITRELTEDCSPGTIVVGWPGPIAPDGTVLRSPTVLGPEHDRPIAVGRLLSRIWPMARIAVLNDLTCAGYAYVGLGYRDFCIFTVGSGIANKVFVDARPILGPGGRGGEAGHLAAHFGADCPNGMVPPESHLGDVASGRGTLRLGRELARLEPDAFSRSKLAGEGPQFANEALVAAFHAGDRFARRIVGLATQALGHAIASVHAIVGTEHIVLTGGFATALGEDYRAMLVERARQCTWEVGQDWNAMIELGQEVDGLTGAAVYARRELLGGILGNVA